MPMGTGCPDADAREEFSRARRRQVLSRLAARLRGRSGEMELILPFDEVVAALGRVAERDLGLHSVALDTIVGTVDRTGEFDRRFRPTSYRTRARFEGMAAAARRGASFPPISVYRVGEAHFVRDGHHRVAVSRSLRRTHIDAYVTEVETRVGAGVDLRITDLPVKSQERLFRERVPLSPDRHARIRLRDRWSYGILAEGVEAWGYRVSLERGRLLDRSELAEQWFDTEYEPVVRLLREAELVAEGDEADGYLRLGGERYRLLGTMAWDEAVLDALRQRR